MIRMLISSPPMPPIIPRSHSATRTKATVQKRSKLGQLLEVQPGKPEEREHRDHEYDQDHDPRPPIAFLLVPSGKSMLFDILL